MPISSPVDRVIPIFDTNGAECDDNSIVNSLVYFYYLSEHFVGSLKG